MEEFTLEINPRSETGSASNKRLRKQGNVPAVIYGCNEPSVACSASTKLFTMLAEKASSSQVFTLKSGDKKLDGRPAIVKEVQVEPLKGRILHVDLQVLRDDEAVRVSVPLKFVGDAIGVKDDGGVLSISAHELEVSCLPRAIPRAIEVPVAALRVGHSLHASDLALPKDVKLAGNPGLTIVSVVIAKTAVEETTTATDAAAAEGAAAPAAGDAAAPAKDDKAAAKPAKK